jgi:hypothetical protein
MAKIAGYVNVYDNSTAQLKDCYFFEILKTIIVAWIIRDKWGYGGCRNLL